jgi:heme exporter protein D
MNEVIEFFEMGGYALYVWGSFGATALLMIAEPIMLRNRRNELMRRLARMARVNSEVTK